MNESYKPNRKDTEDDEAVLGFTRVIRHVGQNAVRFGGWGPKTSL
jgi:hypothetical protein